MKSIRLFLLFITLVISPLLKNYSAKECSAKSTETKYISDFWHTYEDQILDENNDPVQIKSIQMLGTWWYPDKHYGEAPTWDHDEASYSELKELGFNCVRLMMGYMYFEDKPYDYSKTDWGWIDKNIEWAKKNDMKIIITMDKSQIEDFYEIDDDNLNRLISLWNMIAKHYKDCKTIVGWEILNEPEVDSSKNISVQCDNINTILNQIAGSIREIDTNHIIFCNRSTIKTGENDGKLKGYIVKLLNDNNINKYPSIKDRNVVYSFHFHYPTTFTMQLGFWDEYPGKYMLTHVDKGKLNNELLRISRLYQKANDGKKCPVFISEFCVKFRSESIKSTQGYAWLSDSIDLFNKNNFSYNYDTYHSETVGLWDAPTWQDYRKGSRDEVLASMFKKFNMITF